MAEHRGQTNISLPNPKPSDDPTTRRMLEEILAMEEEHAEDLAGLLKELGS
jgi:bacterioferritin (cytochrome b1)